MFKRPQYCTNFMAAVVETASHSAAAQHPTKPVKHAVCYVQPSSNQRHPEDTETSLVRLADTPHLLLLAAPSLLLTSCHQPTTDIIVDPCFTDAFIQQPSTATYNKLLSELPRAFVGTATELRRMVALLTQQSIRAYSAKVGAACLPRM